ncbi:MAG: hypothetical protein D8M59_09660 [Planctomycetes bacterium]|nr:hypothetical protein [Planctomycetota bacterium]
MPYGLRVAYGRLWPLRGRFYRMTCPARDVEQTLRDTPMFFLLGSGRCGTMIITRILNSDPNAHVLHEPFGHADVLTRPRARLHPEYARYYVQHYRRYEIYRQIRRTRPSCYGEVSSRPRVLGRAFQDAFPQARLFILVRDGRDTVSSALNRHQLKHGGFEKTSDAIYRGSKPAENEPLDKPWNEMTHFERVCWWWNDAYRTLLDQLPETPVIKFEKVVSDWTYVQTHLVRPLGLALDEADWQNALATRSENAAASYVVRPTEEWTRDESETFDRLCGTMMQRLGYGGAVGQ